MTIERGSNSPGILFEKVSIGSYGFSIGVLLLEDELLDELEGILLEEVELELAELLDELLELLELLELEELELDETLLDELTLELVDELTLLDDVVELLELASMLLSLVLLDCSLEVLLSEEVDSSILVEVLKSLDEKLVSLGVVVTQEDRSKEPNTVNE